jgi:hypothetical protein
MVVLGGVRMAGTGIARWARRQTVTRRARRREPVHPHAYRIGVRGYPPGMQLPLAPPLVLAALLTAGPAATDTVVEPPLRGPGSPSTAVHAVVTPPAPSCPAYLGPRCDSPAHDRWADGQALAELARPEPAGPVTPP